VLQAQTQAAERFGEAALRLKLITPVQLRSALAQQFNYPLALGNSRLAPALIAAFDPASEYAESLRSLRSELLLRWFGEQGSTLAVIACDARDGGNTLAANLAITFAQLGERTLLVDLNLRQPTLHTLFGTKSREGITDLLDRRVSFDAIAVEEPFPNLHLLSAGAIPPNPQELLSQPRFAHLIAEFAAHFDAVILDAPPMQGSADAQLIAARARGAVLAVRRHRTRIGELHRMKQQLATSGCALLGAVLHD
jgi:protein-tyrosine kinase